MDGLRNYTTEKKFWSLIEAEAANAQEEFLRLWALSETCRLSKKEACECLNALFIYSHSRIQNLLGKSATAAYPTTKCSPNRLVSKPALWWVDHFTAGISHISTLNWFGTPSPGRVSTHFIIGYHADPFYILPLQHGAWHAPARNADSWSIEMVNAGPVKPRKDEWLLWNGRILPEKLVKELPPQAVTPEYKGAKYFQPFTTDQVKNNIKLKRVLRWATEDKLLDRARMTQHSQWQPGKFDMGPLWPLDDVNDAAFEDYPLDELQAYHNALMAIELPGERPTCKTVYDDTEACSESIEYGEKENPEDETTETHSSIEEIQILLANKGYGVSVDGIYGPVTRANVVKFQRSWNTYNPLDILVVDGVAGPQTLDRLRGKK